jgi:hypothetical protein
MGHAPDPGKCGLVLEFRTVAGLCTRCLCLARAVAWQERTMGARQTRDVDRLHGGAAVARAPAEITDLRPGLCGQPDERSPDR